jgi:hypothetical protein
MKGKGIAAAALTLIALGLAGCSSSDSSSPEITAPDFTGFTFPDAERIARTRGVEIKKIGPLQCVNPKQIETGFGYPKVLAKITGQDVVPGQPVPPSGWGRKYTPIFLLLECPDS